MARSKLFDCVCVICGTPFKGYHRGDKCCSERCQKEHKKGFVHQYTYTCKSCGAIKTTGSKQAAQGWRICFECWREHVKIDRIRQRIGLIKALNATIEQLTESNDALKQENERLKSKLNFLMAVDTPERRSGSPMPLRSQCHVRG